MGFLKFMLLCTDFLVWPLFALAYLLCASIMAIETGSKYHMRKLVTYWTLFSLISLFELTFVKIIKRWLPFWSCIKLIATCWLVYNRFNGAVDIYQNFVHPCLPVKLQATIKSFYKPKEEMILMTKTFPNISETRENASEHTASSEPKPVQHAHADNVGLIRTKTDAPTEFTEMIQPKKAEREWTCAICQVTTMGEKPFNAHLQGNKHKSKIRELITSRYNVKNTGSLSSTKGIINQADRAAKKRVGEGSQKKPSNKNDEKVTFHSTGNMGSRAGSQTFNFWCGFCNVKLLSDTDMAAHLKGKKHSSIIQKLKEQKNSDSSHSDIKVQEQDDQQNPSATPKHLKETGFAHEDKGTIEVSEQASSHEPKLEKHAQSNNVALVKKNNVAAPEVNKKMIPSEAEKGGCEWICALCKVTTTSEKTLNAHLQGNKHKSNIAALRTLI